VLSNTNAIRLNRRGASALLSAIAASAVVAALALGASGCTLSAGTQGELVYGHPVVRVDAPPPDIQVYPRVYYQGGYAYLVGDAWYYYTPRGWVYFRSEPRELAERRVYVQQRGRPGRPSTASPPRYYEEPPPPPPQAPVERGRRYYPD